MGILIGMDEAGYGPNFGPLVVAATAWEVPDEGSGFGVQGSEELRISDFGLRIAKRGRQQSAIDELAEQSAIRNPKLTSISIACCATSSPRAPASGALPLPIRRRCIIRGSGLRQLERGVHAVLAWRCEQIASLLVGDRGIIVGPIPTAIIADVCWPDGFDCSLPVDAAADELSRARRPLRAGVRRGAACGRW